MRILLVDPDAASRKAISSWLDEFFGQVSIDEASSADAALQAFETRSPDLVMASLSAMGAPLCGTVHSAAGRSAHCVMRGIATMHCHP